MKTIKTIIDVSVLPQASCIVGPVWWVGRGPWSEGPTLTKTGCNVYLLRGEAFDVLIDAGMGPSQAELEQRVCEAGSRPGRVGEIWITHSHWDHLGGAAGWMKKYPHVRCRLSAEGAKFLRRNDYRLVGVPISGAAKDFNPPPRVLPLKPGQVLRCRPYELKVVPLPGHTPDCVAFRGQIAGVDVMFTGDAIIGDQGAARGVTGWLDGLWLSDAAQYARTLEAALADPPELLLPGHGVPSAGPAAQRSIRNCLWRIRKLLAIPHLGTMLPVLPKGL